MVLAHEKYIYIYFFSIIIIVITVTNKTKKKKLTKTKNIEYRVRVRVEKYYYVTLVFRQIDFSIVKSCVMFVFFFFSFLRVRILVLRLGLFSICLVLMCNLKFSYGFKTGIKYLKFGYAIYLPCDFDKHVPIRNYVRVVSLDVIFVRQEIRLNKPTQMFIRLHDNSICMYENKY